MALAVTSHAVLCLLCLCRLLAARSGSVCSAQETAYTRDNWQLPLGVTLPAASDVKFLWEHSEANGDSNGIHVPWCNQLKVLCHWGDSSFLIHCGMTSVFAGCQLPMDQPTDSRHIFDVWKIGFSLKEKMRSDGLIGTEEMEIVLAVKNLMSVNASDSKEMRRGANSLKGASHRAIEERGSSCGEYL
ncbi:UDP-glycosyltransferase 87A2-like [Panicum hallii]|uniref:UDP-glycosyltransferase 87A2-like n=1 Tax=Panicum hallii TaxID=206008 RepID=UPI000DF4CF73|nr:UDP-glycosyltransferase 87A2-like [Panicum hallii]